MLKWQDVVLLIGLITHIREYWINCVSHGLFVRTWLHCDTITTTTLTCASSCIESYSLHNHAAQDQLQTGLYKDRNWAEKLKLICTNNVSSPLLHQKPCLDSELRSKQTWFEQRLSASERHSTAWSICMRRQLRYNIHYTGKKEITSHRQSCRYYADMWDCTA